MVIRTEMTALVPRARGPTNFLDEEWFVDSRQTLHQLDRDLPESTLGDSKSPVVRQGDAPVMSG